jgi:hypothetical protein
VIHRVFRINLVDTNETVREDKDLMLQIYEYIATGIGPEPV